MQELNIGIIGLGWPGERHAEGIQGSGVAKLYGACDLDEKRRQNFRQKHAPTRVFADYREMLAHPQLHAVVASLPNSLPYPTTLKALEAGKPVLSEKPP